MLPAVILQATERAAAQAPTVMEVAAVAAVVAETMVATLTAAAAVVVVVVVAVALPQREASPAAVRLLFIFGILQRALSFALLSAELADLEEVAEPAGRADSAAVVEPEDYTAVVANRMTEEMARTAAMAAMADAVATAAAVPVGLPSE